MRAWRSRPGGRRLLLLIFGAALGGGFARVGAQDARKGFPTAKLVQKINEVVVRRKNTVKWDGTHQGVDFFAGDTVRTLRDARAKVEFSDREVMNLNPNSMAVIKPAKKQFDIELQKGGVYSGNKRVFAQGAEIVPTSRDSKFTATVREDNSTVVEVYSGAANVIAGGKTVSVAAGKATEIMKGSFPSLPVNIPELKDFESRAAQFDDSVRLLRDKAIAISAVKAPRKMKLRAQKVGNVEQILKESRKIKVGENVSAYRIQLSMTQDFSRPLLDKTLDVDEKIDLRAEGVAPGLYWRRIALIDLLGTQGKFSAPRQHQVR